MQYKKVGARYWFSFITAGLVGQIAWAVENNFLNLYVFAAAKSTIYIPIMTATSAIVSTFATILVGVFSDRIGKRKIFISFGYIIWGITIILFAFLMPSNANLTYFPIGLPMVANVGVISGTLIVIMDCIMSFFGSGASDACFNAYVTEKTNEGVRGKVDTILSTLSLVSIILVSLIGGVLIQNSSHHPYWDIFFFVLGGVTIVAGIVCIFLLPSDSISPNKNQSYAQNLIHGFKPSVIKKNPILYIALFGFLVFSIAGQIFMPYLMVYAQQTLGIINEQFTISIGIIIFCSCVLAAIIGQFVDRIGKNRVLIPAVGIAVVGGIIMFCVTSQVGAILGGIVIMCGNLLGIAIFGAKVRDYTPHNEAGLLQGVRMIFVVMFPMVTGPYIGQGVSYIQGKFIQNEFGDWVILPNKYIFLFASIFFALSIPIIIYMIKKEKELSNTKAIVELNVNKKINKK
ncbi:MAG: MFS transporter [Bacilli bacterium]|nr:MFS transporter [Bacilli bacterium]